MDLVNEIDNLNFTIKSRYHFSLIILNNPNHLIEVISFLNTSKLEYSEKILAVLEYSSRINPMILVPFSNQLINLAKNYSGPSGTRALSKILFNFIKQPSIHLNPQQNENMISICFDWMIGNEKVAVKAFSMQSLHLLSYEYH